MATKTQEFAAVKVSASSSRRGVARVSHSAFSLASQLSLPAGCKLALNSVLATRVTTQGPPLVVKDGDTELKMVPGFMRQSVTDTTATEFVGMGAANPTDYIDAALLSFINSKKPMEELLEVLIFRLAHPVSVKNDNDTWLIMGTYEIFRRQHRCHEVILGVMGRGKLDEPDKQIRKWFLIHGGEPVTYAKSASGSVVKVVLRCDTNTQIVHNAGVSCRVKDGAITIKLKDGDIMW